MLLSTTVPPSTLRRSTTVPAHGTCGTAFYTCEVPVRCPVEVDEAYHAPGVFVNICYISVLHYILQTIVSHPMKVVDPLLVPRSRANVHYRWYGSVSRAPSSFVNCAFKLSLCPYNASIKSTFGKSPTSKEFEAVERHPGVSPTLLMSFREIVPYDKWTTHLTQ